jgi:hypothetical protein
MLGQSSELRLQPQLLVFFRLFSTRKPSPTIAYVVSSMHMVNILVVHRFGSCPDSSAFVFTVVSARLQQTIHFVTKGP